MSKLFWVVHYIDVRVDSDYESDYEKTVRFDAEYHSKEGAVAAISSKWYARNVWAEKDPEEVYADVIVY